MTTTTFNPDFTFHLPSVEYDLIYKIAITKVARIGHKNAKLLINHFGSPRAVFSASRKELSAVFGIGDRRISEIKGSAAIEKAHQEVEYNKQNGIHAIYFKDKDYPDRLKEVTDGPIMLYTKGQVDFNAERMIAVVGTRKPTSAGIDLCTRLIEEMSEYKPTIISGLAFGIDATAHRAALACGLPTIGVVAHGLADIYPAKHRGLAQRMTTNGGILSEFTHSIKAEREFFPMRNRIIAGLSDGLVVAQTAIKGGSMISADLANAYHREVFAFPGRVGDLSSQGGNLLIKNNRAHLIESATDVAFQLGWDQSQRPQKTLKLFEDLSDVQRTVVDAMQTDAAISIDELAASTDISQHELPTILLQLEFKNVVRNHPGKCYSLK